MSGSETPVSPVTGSRPPLTVVAPAVNHEPVELDGTPASPESIRLSRRGSKAHALEVLEAERHPSAAEQQRRAELVSQRQKNPAVVVDLPEGPGPEEIEKSEDVRDDAPGKGAKTSGPKPSLSQS